MMPLVRGTISSEVRVSAVGSFSHPDLEKLYFPLLSQYVTDTYLFNAANPRKSEARAPQ